MNWQGWRPQENAVLVLIQAGHQVLLIHKKRGLGQGKVMIPGGRVEAQESAEQAAVRETQEETGLTPTSLIESAELNFQFTDGYALAVRVFRTTTCSGTLAACEEASPFWHPVSELPWNSMWADDALWLPQVLQNQLVTGRFLFDKELMREAEIRVHHRPSGPTNG